MKKYAEKKLAKHSNYVFGPIKNRCINMKDLSISTHVTDHNFVEEEEPCDTCKLAFFRGI